MSLLHRADRLKTREREDRAAAEISAFAAQNGGRWPTGTRLGEQDAIDTLYWPQPEGWEQFNWTAWYRDDIPDDSGHLNQCYGDTELRAITNLRNRFPREA